MKNSFPYVEVPDHLRPIIGEPDQGTRMYRVYGREEDVKKWFDTVLEISGENGAVSPGGVGMYTGISRTGVHKRLKEGKLTIFLFHVIKDVRILKGKKLANDGRPYGFIPVCECKAWANDVVERSKSNKAAAEAERVGDKDWNDDFLGAPKDWKSKLPK